MATQQQFNGTGSQTDFVINEFEFLQPGDVNVKIGTDVQESPSDYSIDGTTIKFTSAPASGTNNITAERDTNIATKAHTYEPGSSITAKSLNDNQNQALFKLEENAKNAVTTTTLAGNKSTITVSSDNVTWSINDDVIDNQHLKDNAVDTAEIKANAVTTNEIEDNAVTMAKLASGVLPTDITVDHGNIVSNAIRNAEIKDSEITLAKLASSLLTSIQTTYSNPVGTIIWYAGETAPTGYLKANGDSIANGSGTTQSITADFSALYAIVGATLPDLRGEFIRGWDDSKGTDSGREIRSTQSDDNKAHVHTITDPGHKHTTKGHGTNDDGGNNVTGSTSSGTSTSSMQDNTTGITIDSTGTESRPRNVALLACIKY